MHKSKRRWLCVDCSTHTGLEHFYVHLSIWNSVMDSECGMLCVGCLEARLGRLLRPDDFTGAHINDPRKNAMTDRLRSRICGTL